MSEKIVRATKTNNKHVLAAFIVRIIRMIESGDIETALVRLRGLVDKLKG